MFDHVFFDLVSENIAILGKTKLSVYQNYIFTFYNLVVYSLSVIFRCGTQSSADNVSTYARSVDVSNSVENENACKKPLGLST